MIESIEAALFPIVCKINEYLSNYILVFLLLGIGFWYSIKTRFVQIRCFKEGWNSVFGNLSLRGKKHDSGMSSFQALATAIAAQVGTGNIVGASGAILTGNNYWGTATTDTVNVILKIADSAGKAEDATVKGNFRLRSGEKPDAGLTGR